MSSSSSEDISATLQQLVTGVNSIQSTLTQMVTRQDLETYHSWQMEETKSYIPSQVEPIKQNLLSQEADIADLQGRMSAFELDGPSSSLSLQQIRLMNSLDPANKRIQFHGFPSSMMASQRIKEMEDIMARYTDFKSLYV